MTNDQIIQAIQALAHSEKIALLAKLQDISAAESKVSVEKHRLAAIRAAQNDPARQVAFKSSLRGLNRLGLSLDRLAALRMASVISTAH